MRHPLAALAAARGDIFLWLPIWLGTGIGIWFGLAWEPGRAVYASVAAAMVLGAIAWLRGPDAGRLVAAALTVAALGFLLAGARAHTLAAPVLGFRYYGPVEGRIISIDRSSGDYIRLKLDQVVLASVAPARTPATARVALHGDQSQLAPEPGQRVMMTANLMPPAGPASPQSYDFRRNSWFAQLGAVGYVRAPVLLLEPPAPGDWLLAGHRTRMRLSAAIQARIPGQAGAVAAALMTGDRSGIAEATNVSMRASNLYHIISISGLHMGMLAGFVFAALRYGLALVGNLALHLPVKKIAAAVALLAASIYLWLAGPNVATERAYVMAATMLVAVLLDRRAISLRTVAVAALALLLINPEGLMDPGFQMSFSATIALILVYRPWARVQHLVPGLLKPVAMLVLSSLAAGFASAPIAAAHFNRMPEYGLLANLLAVPVMGTAVMPAGVIAALLAPLGLAGPPLWVMEQGTRWMILVSDWVAGLDGALISLPTPPEAVLPLMAVAAALMVLARGAARGAGFAVAIAVVALWAGVERPALLIAPEGELVGLMTADGRAMSKSGAAYVAETWMAEDGDDAPVEAASARAGWDGPTGSREAVLAGRRVVHLTGKGAADRVAAACTGGAIVVLAAAATETAPGDCLLFDLTRLRQSGAVAITPAGDALRVVTVAETIGPRLWAR
ncbi:MAG: ComEC family competence protein [Rhodobacteraceae bacterium]|nr:ComEC family competence protein [Paracoccaceae bacterium]